MDGNFNYIVVNAIAIATIVSLRVSECRDAKKDQVTHTNVCILSENIPLELRSLIPLLDKWSVSGYPIRKNISREIGGQEKKDLINVVYPLMDSINKRCFFQSIIRVDSISIESAKGNSQEILGEKVRNANFLLLTMADHILMVDKGKANYKIFTATIRFNEQSQRNELVNIDSQVVVSDPILDRCFLERVSDPPFFYMGDIYQINKDVSFETNYVYIYLQEFGTKKIELNFPIRGNGKIKFPLDHKIFKHLLRLMNLSKK